jgi:metal-dependent HD superfamily phosphatase/phosphodiesterase
MMLKKEGHMIHESHSQVRSDIVEAEGFDLPISAPPEPPSLPMKRDVRIRIPTRENARLQLLLDRINHDDELYMLWRCANINAVDRLGMSDHGPVHVHIVANIALKLLRLLTTSGIQPSIITNHGLTADDAEVVVVLGALLHDIGMALHRDDHERFSLFLAAPKLRELLDTTYDISARTVIIAETLHAIIAHRSDGRPLTLEAGIVRVADALDMAKGRSRITFAAGKINIHSLSAAAIDRIEIQAGEIKPVRIAVVMLNSAGVFQLDALLKEKLHGSGLEEYVEVIATIQGETEKKLVEVFRV